jgi:hypothetical protein
MEYLKATDEQLAQLLNDVQTVLNNSEWTFRIVTIRSLAPVIMQGAWTAAKAISLAKHYNEKITPHEAKQRAASMNIYVLDQSRQIIQLAAWLAQSKRLELLWGDRSLPYEERKRQSEMQGGRKSLRYKRADCTMLALQIEDIAFGIDQTVLIDAEYFKTFVVTRISARTKNLHRSVSIYSQGLGKVISTTKTIEFSNDIQLRENLARLMPGDATNKEGVIPKLLIGFAPPGDLFDTWVERQLEDLRKRYTDKIVKQELESVLIQLREQAHKSRNKRGGDKISAKDVTYFRELLKKEIDSTD